MVNAYINLPQWVVNVQSVNEFQSSLTEQARERCRSKNDSWASSFSCLDARVDFEEDLPVLD